MTQRIAVLALTLAALLPAAPPAEAHDDDLAKTILTDLECYHDFLERVHDTIKAEPDTEFSKRSKAQYQEGIKTYTKAKEDYQAGRYLQAYKGLFAAKQKLKPCFKELCRQGVSTELQNTIARQVGLLAEQLKATKRFIQENVKKEDMSRKATRIYQEAERIYQQAKQHKDAGRDAEAWEGFDLAQQKLHQAMIHQLQFTTKRRRGK